jgi:hypothetical protein
MKNAYLLPLMRVKSLHKKQRERCDNMFSTFLQEHLV